MRFVFSVRLAAVCAMGTGLSVGVAVAHAADELPVAPKLELTKMLSGPAPEALSWETLSGNVVVIEFWATWCAPCVGAIPHLNELVDKFADKPVKFLSITREEEGGVRRFLRKRPIRGWVGIDLDGTSFSAYGAEGIPHTVIVDTQGRIAGVTSPMDLTEQVIHDVLAGKPLDLAPPYSSEQVSATSTQATKDQEPLFEIVVRRSSPNLRSRQMRPTKLDAKGWSIREVVAFVYDLPVSQVMVPAELSDQYYDVLLRWPQEGGVDPRASIEQILRPAFGITVKEARRDVEAYVLDTPEAGALKMTRNVVSGATAYQTTVDGVIHITNLGADAICRTLTDILGKPVLNESGLSGGYDCELVFDQENPVSILNAAREQLGLSITKVRRNVPFVVVTAE